MGTIEGGGNIVTDGLVLYLDAANIKSYISGSTSWNDLSKSSNNGTLVNGPTFNSSNKGSIVFDGTNDTTTFASSPSLQFLNTSPYTLNIFAKILNSTAIFSGFLNRESGSSRNGYNLWFYRDSINQVAIASERFGGTGQKVTYILLDNNQCINVWNQYTITYDGTTLSFYLNGVFKHSALANGNITNTTKTLEIGSRLTDYANCEISNITIYDKSLSSSEIVQNYNTTKTRFGL
jgi:hypothetical protein